MRLVDDVNKLSMITIDCYFPTHDEVKAMAAELQLLKLQGMNISPWPCADSLPQLVYGH